MLAKIHSVFPLAVQLKGATVGTPATFVCDDTFDVGDDVWVGIDENKVVVIAKVGSP